MEIRVIVCGGRNYADRAKVFDVLDRVAAKHGVVFVIHGGAAQQYKGINF